MAASERLFPSEPPDSDSDRIILISASRHLSSHPTKLHKCRSLELLPFKKERERKKKKACCEEAIITQEPARRKERRYHKMNIMGC